MWGIQRKFFEVEEQKVNLFTTSTSWKESMKLLKQYRPHYEPFGLLAKPVAFT